MKRSIRSIIAFSLVILLNTACQSSTEGTKDGFKDGLNLPSDSLTTSPDSSQMPAIDSSTVKTEELVVDLQLAPKIYNARVLSKPHPTAIHPDWKASELGKAWSLFAHKKITNATGVYYEGDLISPRGGKLEQGPYFFFVQEWE